MNDFQRYVKPWLLTPRILPNRRGPNVIVFGWLAVAYVLGLAFYYMMALTVSLGWDTLVIVYGGAVLGAVKLFRLWRSKRTEQTA